MAINTEDGDYALACWEDAGSDDAPSATEYSDSLDELKQRAMSLLEGGKYSFVALSRWNAAADDWEELEAFEAEDE
ncbi:MAG: hypothetical protein ABUS48_05825 [Pseudomonadota bacterium]